MEIRKIIIRIEIEDNKHFVDKMESLLLDFF